MKYTLVSSERSPFGRICRMFMLAHKIDFEFQKLNYLDSPEASQILAEESPINKVPYMVIDGNQKLFDSRVIVNYLTEKHGIKKLSLNEENLVSAIYSCLDTTVALFIMKMSDYDIRASNFYLDRQHKRFPSNLVFLKPWVEKLDAQNPNDWNYVSMSLYSFVYFTKNRSKMIELGEYPFLEKFLTDFAEAPAVKETSF